MLTERLTHAGQRMRFLATIFALLASAWSTYAPAQSSAGCLATNPPIAWTLPTTPETPNWTLVSSGFTSTGDAVPFSATFWRRPECPTQLILTLDPSGPVYQFGFWSAWQTNPIDLDQITYMIVNDPAEYAGNYLNWLHELPAGALSGVVVFGQSIDPSQSLTMEFSPLQTGVGFLPTVSIQIPAALTAVHVNLDQHGLTGSWADPATDGQGLVMEFDPDFYSTGTGLVFGGWYTYDVNSAGRQRWYTLQGQTSASSASSTAGIYFTDGGEFASSLATATTQVGQATLQFSDCANGSLTYVFTDGSGRQGRIPLTRLLPNVTCTPAGDNSNTASDYLWSGAWADLSNSGQGIVFDINPIDNVLFAGWYTYAPDANQGFGPSGQHWYTLQAVLAPGTSSAQNIGIYDTTGGAFNQPAATATNQVGTAVLVFNSCISATLSYEFTAGTNAGSSGALNLSRIASPPAACKVP